MNKENEQVDKASTETIEATEVGVITNDKIIDETLDKVSIIILSKHKEHDSLCLRQCLRSLKNIQNIDAQILVVGDEKPAWLDESAFIKYDNASELEMIKAGIAASTENKIIIMLDNMFIINKITLADIAVIKAHAKDGGFDYATNTPCMIRKNIAELVFNKMDGLNFIQEYFVLAKLTSMPIILNWQKDSWLLPVVSDNPSDTVMHNLLKSNKFMFYKNGCSSDQLAAIINELFPTTSDCEIKNEDKE